MTEFHTMQRTMRVRGIKKNRQIIMMMMMMMMMTVLHNVKCMHLALQQTLTRSLCVCACAWLCHVYYVYVGLYVRVCVVWYVFRGVCDCAFAFECAWLIRTNISSIGVYIKIVS